MMKNRDKKRERLSIDSEPVRKTSSANDFRKKLPKGN